MYVAPEFVFQSTICPSADSPARACIATAGDAGDQTVAHPLQLHRTSGGSPKVAPRNVLSERGSPDDIWDDLLRSQPREKVARALTGHSRYDDHAAVLVFAAMLEQYLEVAITSVLRTSPRKSAKLFAYEDKEGGGPLATFAAKIKMGEALGLYEESIVEDLNLIKLIRNVFAHVQVRIDFEHEAVMQACRALQVIKNLREIGLEVGHGGKAWSARC